MTSLRPALFLDRDGVIIENRPDYVRRWEDVQFYPQALQALVRLAASPLAIVIVTNQSAVGRGLISLAEMDAINARIVEAIRQAGGRIDAVYACPHAPEEGCECRKPRPGMLLRAAEELGLDLGRSVMVGDALTDMQAGMAAGVDRVGLVRSGRGRAQEALPGMAAIVGLMVFDDLEAAARANFKI